MRWALRAAVILLCLSVSVLMTEYKPSAAESSTDAAKGLMEKSLSMVEIDREIDSLLHKQRQTEDRIRHTEFVLSEQEHQIQVERRQAGDVLRAYYTGERDTFWTALISLNSWPNLFTVYEYIEQIAVNDRRALKRYIEAYRETRLHRNYLIEANRELIAMTERLTAQRERLVQLHEEIQAAFAASSEPEPLKLSIERLTADWKTKGLRAVKQYFAALATAMQDFPEFLADNRQNLTIRGLSYSMLIREQELNEYLLQKNSIFEHFKFRLEPGQISAYGKDDDLEIKIVGHYTLQEEPEHSFRFHVDQLWFNGLELPEFTRNELSEQFDLNFYPKKLVSFFRANDIVMNEGELIVELQLDWGRS